MHCLCKDKFNVTGSEIESHRARTEAENSIIFLMYRFSCNQGGTETYFLYWRPKNQFLANYMQNCLKITSHCCTFALWDPRDMKNAKNDQFLYPNLAWPGKVFGAKIQTFKFQKWVLLANVPLLDLI